MLVFRRKSVFLSKLGSRVLRRSSEAFQYPNCSRDRISVSGICLLKFFHVCQSRSGSWCRPISSTRAILPDNRSKIESLNTDRSKQSRTGSIIARSADFVLRRERSEEGFVELHLARLRASAE